MLFVSLEEFGSRFCETDVAPRRYLTNEGIEYLRTYLHLPPEIVPSTLKRNTRLETARPRPTAAPRSGDASKVGEDRSAYRRNPGGAGGPDKKGDVGAGTGDVEFVSEDKENIISNFVYSFCVCVQFLYLYFSVADSVEVPDLHNKFDVSIALLMIGRCFPSVFVRFAFK